MVLRKNTTGGITGTPYKGDHWQTSALNERPSEKKVESLVTATFSIERERVSV